MLTSITIIKMLHIAVFLGMMAGKFVIAKSIVGLTTIMGVKATAGVTVVSKVAASGIAAVL